MDTTQGQRQASDAITGAAQTFAPESYSTYLEDVFYPQSGVAAAPSTELAPTDLVAEPFTPSAPHHSTISAPAVAETLVAQTVVAETVVATPATMPAPARPAAPAPRGRHSVRPPMQRGLASRGGSTRRGDVAITIAGIGLGISMGLGGATPAATSWPQACSQH